MTNKRLLTIFLGLITLVLAGVGVLIALNLESVQAPDDVSAAGSCQGPGTANCTGIGGGAVLCGGRSENNCKAIASLNCGCSWVADNQTPQPQPPQQPSGICLTGNAACKDKNKGFNVSISGGTCTCTTSTAGGNDCACVPNQRQEIGGSCGANSQCKSNCCSNGADGKGGKCRADAQGQCIGQSPTAPAPTPPSTPTKCNNSGLTPSLCHGADFGSYRCEGGSCYRCNKTTSDNCSRTVVEASLCDNSCSQTTTTRPTLVCGQRCNSTQGCQCPSTCYVDANTNTQSRNIDINASCPITTVGSSCPSCQASQFCNNNNICESKRNLGSPCSSQAQCVSNNCSGGVCVTAAGGGSGVCDTQPGQCAQGANTRCCLGAQLVTSSSCSSGYRCITVSSSSSGTFPEDGICRSAGSCFGRAYNETIAFSTTSCPTGNCRCIHQGGGVCGCLTEGNSCSAAPAGGTLGFGAACTSNDQCGYSGSRKLTCGTCSDSRRVCGDFSSTPSIQAACFNSADIGNLNPLCDGCGSAGCPVGSFKCTGSGVSGQRCGSGGWESPVAADACGASCSNTGGSSIFCQCNDQSCTNCAANTRKCYQGAILGSGFVGCGGQALVAGYSGASNNSCANCYRNQSGNGGHCILEATSCGANSACYGSSTSQPPSQSTSDTTPTTPTGGTTPPPPSAPVCGDGICATGEACEASGTQFRMCRLEDNGSAPGGSIVNDCDIPNTCNVVDAPQCIALTRLNGTGDIAPGQQITYQVQYTAPTGTPPFSSVGLYVSTDGTVANAVGQDAEGTGQGNVIVNPNTGFPQDSGTGTWTYQFTWEATGVADATTYPVRLILNGNTVEATAACQSSLTTDQSVPLEPDFTPVKTSASVCVEGGGAVINYTITVTNNTTVNGTLDQLVDNPAGVGVISNVSPAATSVSNSQILWSGPITINAGQTLTYTYTLTLNQAEAESLRFTGAENSVTIQFDTPSQQDNTRRFDHRARVEICLPDTSLFAHSPVLVIGLMLILAGVVVNRTGKDKRDGTAKLFGNLVSIDTEELGSRFMSYEDRVVHDTKKKAK